MQIDYYLQHLIRHRAQGVEFASGQAVRFHFPSGPQDGKSPIEHAELVGLVEEIAPAEVWGGLLRNQGARFSHTVEGQSFELNVQPTNERVWRLHVRPEVRVSATEPPAASAATGQGETPETIDELLAAMVRAGASDLHLCTGVVPMVRVDGSMRPLSAQPMRGKALRALLEGIAPTHRFEQFEKTSDTDFAYELKGVARFRVNLFSERRGAGAVFRQIPMKVKTVKELGLPDGLLDLCKLSKGLVLVTGPTGSGKSTTLAALVDHINRTRSDHIITIEDPIEFVHENQKCLVNQREVGVHTESFKQALRAALREDPDVVLVGELRDLETVSIALETAETGHLVFGTLHTTSARGTVDRIVDQFSAAQQEQVRTMLAETLRGVVAQVLCKRVSTDGRVGPVGRVAAHEVLLHTPALSNLIREGKTHQITTVLQTGKAMGMHTMNEHLTELVSSGVVASEEALRHSNDRQQLKDQLTRAGLHRAG